MSDLTPQSDAPTPTTDKITQAARETIYLCNFRVSVDGEWLCLRELNDISLTPDPEPAHEGESVLGTWLPLRGETGEAAWLDISLLSFYARQCLKTPSHISPSSIRQTWLFAEDEGKS